MLPSVLLSVTFIHSVLALPVIIVPPFTLFSRQTPELEAATDRLLFATSMQDFLAARAAQDPPGLDWSSDGCSDSPDDPFGFNFNPSCERHDFGYRNYKKQDRFTDANKLRIDNNFKQDMFDECATEDEQGILGEIGVGKDVCEATATVYYEAVRTFGSKEKL
jgi:Prokaryotic phospholipase A2